MSDMAAGERQQVREEAEGRCDHIDRWLSREDGYTTEACWSCLIDAYFQHRAHVEVIEREAT